jgi:hypothetical protein
VKGNRIMATLLDKPLIRETGLVRENGKEVVVILTPSEVGGSLAFREKGKGGKGCEISLKTLMDSAFAGTPAVVKKEEAKQEEHQDGELRGPSHDPDLVDLADLETLIMVNDNEEITTKMQSLFFDLIREAREQRRENLGEPALYMGTKKSIEARRFKDRAQE